MPNLLGEFEARLGKVVEGTFGAMFRSPVQPAELARAAGKEMTRTRKLGLDKMYVANVYFVFISPRDADAMGDLVSTIEGELETYLLAFARERDYSFVTRPVVRFSVDEKLKRQGKFDIIGQQMTPEAIFEELGSVAGVTDTFEAEEEHLAPAGTARPAAQVPAIAPTPLPEPVPDPLPDAVDSWAGTPAPAHKPATAVVPDAAPVTPTVTRVSSVVLPDLGEVELSPNRSYITGRQSSCDLPVADANISRQHAEFFWDGEGWSVRDLGSTNGTSLNGRKITAAAELHDGDRITLGVSTLIYHESSRMG
jgi:hypothetical protein